MDFVGWWGASGEAGGAEGGRRRPEFTAVVPPSGSALGQRGVEPAQQKPVMPSQALESSEMDSRWKFASMRPYGRSAA